MLALNAAGVLSVAYSPEWEHLSNGNAVLNSLIVTIVSPQLHAFLFAITGFHLMISCDHWISSHVLVCYHWISSHDHWIASDVMITGFHHML